MRRIRVDDLTKITRENKYLKPDLSQSTLYVANNFMLEPVILTWCTMCRMQPIKDIWNKMYFIWLDVFRAKISQIEFICSYMLHLYIYNLLWYCLLVIIHIVTNSFNRNYFKQYHIPHYISWMGSKENLKLHLCSVRLICQERCICVQSTWNCNIIFL